MKLCVCGLSPNNRPVRNGLAYTPAQMYERMKIGIPIASGIELSDDNFVAGDRSDSMVVDSIYRRGYDLNQAWNDQFDARERIGENSPLKLRYTRKRLDV